jgi:DNA topoisomerase-3
MNDIQRFTTETVQELDKLKGVKIERANLGACPVCGRDVVENRKGYSCWSKDDPGCGFVIWKRKASKSLPVSVAQELMESLRASRERGEDPGVGRTAKPVTGFRGRSGRTFRAKLKLEQDAEGKWRVDFDEDWAKEPPAERAEEEPAQAR